MEETEKAQEEKVIEEQQENADEQLENVEETEVDTEKERAEKERAEKERIEAELKELNERFLRVQADYDNFRKRTKAEKEAAAKYRSQSLAEQLLPVLDNFERALSVETTNEESKSILQGVEMVYRQFLEALKQEDIEEVEAYGVPFDPNKHQAVMQEKSEEHEPGIVLEVLQKGYRLKDRVIRPAMVKVNE
ncbi:nucleotide exchange factor GrpE [Pueribacillus theae]|uniref:Protein GrpE n=2 Tax=Pueribacillus theae TaxID=2171751 RepID=A0A2U1K4X4_9BACI|nr:nucleotide exchange factor GrpE [Pueribacillus theae]